MGLPEFTAALREELRRSPLNQSTLAEQADVSQGMINAWLQGQVKKPDLDKVAAVERALALPPARLTRHLGWVPVDADVVDLTAAIDAEPWLDPWDKAAMRDLYDALRQRPSTPTAKPRRKADPYAAQEELKRVKAASAAKEAAGRRAGRRAG